MKKATVEIIKDVVNHPNADALDVVQVLGYKAIVKRDQFKAGDKIIFIQPDMVLPNAEWATFYKAKSNRTKAIRLRQVWSEGIVETFEHTNCLEFPVGTEVSGYIGVTKYDPPVPDELNAKGWLPYGIPKTDEERWNNIEDIPYGEIVDVTLKIDGSSLTVYCKETDGAYDQGVTSRTLDLYTDKDNKYTIAARTVDIHEKLLTYCKLHNVNLALRGEMSGQGVQALHKNPHAAGPVTWSMFSVFNIDTHEQEYKGSPHYFLNIAQTLNIKTVDVIEHDVVLTPELIHKYEEELETVNGAKFEGVVINGNNFTFKVINKSYDSKK